MQSLPSVQLKENAREGKRRRRKLQGAVPRGGRGRGVMRMVRISNLCHFLFTHMTSFHSLTSSWSTLTVLGVHLLDRFMCAQKACVVGVYISMCVCGPLLTSGASQSGTGTGTDNGGNDIILSQMVSGKLVSVHHF